MSNKVVIEEMLIDGVIYVPKGSGVTGKVNTEGLQYCIVRSYGAGVFAGFVEQKTAEANGMNVRVLNARRIWKWDGASSLSQLAMEGVKKPENCKFPCEVSLIDLFNVVEIIPATEISFNSIKSVVVWEQ